jgi:hypothetical protein
VSDVARNVVRARNLIAPSAADPNVREAVVILDRYLAALGPKTKRDLVLYFGPSVVPAVVRAKDDAA